MTVNTVTRSHEQVAEELRPLVYRLDRKLQRETEALGVTGRQVALLCEVQRRPAIAIGELAEIEGVSPAALSVHIDRLETLGLVERNRSRDDRRRVTLELTGDGKTLLRRWRALRTNWLASHLGRLSTDELDSVGRALPALARLLEDGEQ